MPSRSPDATTRFTIQDVVLALLHSIDERDWDGVRSALADDVDVDYTSLRGGTPDSVPADDLVQGWRTILSRFPHTQHLLGPPLIRTDDVGAEVRAHVRARHVRPAGGPSWTVGGHYRMRLIEATGSWRIRAIRFDVQYQDGNAELEDERSTRDPR